MSKDTSDKLPVSISDKIEKMSKSAHYWESGKMLVGREEFMDVIGEWQKLSGFDLTPK